MNEYENAAYLHGSSPFVGFAAIARGSPKIRQAGSWHGDPDRGSPAEADLMFGRQGFMRPCCP